MDTIRQYILSVICAVIMCGLAQILFPSGNNSLIKLVTGLVVTITVIAPVLEPERLSLDTYFEQISVDGDWAVREGEMAALHATSAFIKEKTETYILDKAAEMGAEITVDIELGTQVPPVPTEITVYGTVSPYVKTQLVECIQQNLGIAEENQRWIS